ncbi:MAG TPA: CoA-binding protein [Chloroflexi bacterium]|nr:CoA-binding protein [Chloroflexota bacterium]
MTAIMNLKFDVSKYQDKCIIQKVLHHAKIIAVVGLSSNVLRASYFVAAYLQKNGYRIIPVNPRETEILGEKCYASLVDVPISIDVVNVFRDPDFLPDVAAYSVKIGAKNLWCQYTVVNKLGGQIAEKAGLSVVMDLCMKVEHARYMGRMHWLGFNTNRITSLRGPVK